MGATALSAAKVFDAFGNTLSSTGVWKGPFGYGGAFGYQSDDSGLQLLGHRYYDPTLGRFLTRDPIQDGRNWYNYCGNDPVNGADPTGLSSAVLPGGGNFGQMLSGFAEALLWPLVVIAGVVAAGVVFAEEGLSAASRMNDGNRDESSSPKMPKGEGRDWLKELLEWLLENAVDYVFESIDVPTSGHPGGSWTRSNSGPDHEAYQRNGVHGLETLYLDKGNGGDIGPHWDFRFRKF